MKYDELCTALVSECEQEYYYVVKIEYSYVSETYETYDDCTSYEIFCFDVDNNIIWFNDWYEGQQYCNYEKPMKINDLIRAYNITNQIKGLRGWPEDCYQQILEIFEKEGDPID